MQICRFFIIPSTFQYVIKLHVETSDWFFIKILPQMYLWTRKTALNFGGNKWKNL